MSTTRAPDRYTALPDEETFAATVVALEEHGFSVEAFSDWMLRATLSSPASPKAQW